MNAFSATVLLAQASPPTAPSPATGSSNGLYTVESMVTLAGASTLTLVISNALQYAFNFNPKWLALAIAQALSIGGVYLTSGDHSPKSIIVALVNGFVIYSAAVGVNKTGGGGGGGRGVATTQSLQSLRRGFWAFWW
jgi:hypothetical protein